MKCRLIIAALLLCLFATTAQARGDDVQYTQNAAEFLTAFGEGSYEEAYEAMSETMQAALPLEKLEQTGAQLTEMFGTFLGVSDDLEQASEPVVEGGISYRQVTASAYYERAIVTFGISINEATGKIEGFFTTNVQAREASEYEELAKEFMILFGEGDFEGAYEYFGEPVKNVLSLEQFTQQGPQITSMYGKYNEIITLSSEVSSDPSYMQVIIKADYEKVICNYFISINVGTKKIDGFQIVDVQSKTIRELPSDLIEETVIVGEGGEYPLEGTLTYPANASKPLPAVVLVHGSGANDRDETIFQNKPFRDIAWGLALQGIAVLRYDKRTYTYGEKITQERIRMTVKSETVDDAVLAIELLRKNPLIDPDRVGVIGHSLGGMLATAIHDEANAWKLVIMAGTLRPLWAVLEDQIAIKTPAEQEAYAQLNTVDVDKLHEIGNFSFISEADAANEMFYILPVDYLKDMEKYDLKALALECTRPMLILQGGEDYQIFADKDFALWQETLDGKPDVILKEYPLLNHLFQERNIENEDIFQEYGEDRPVEETVILDIGAFLLHE